MNQKINEWHASPSGQSPEVPAPLQYIDKCIPANNKLLLRVFVLNIKIIYIVLTELEVDKSYKGASGSDKEDTRREN